MLPVAPFLAKQDASSKKFYDAKKCVIPIPCQKDPDTFRQVGQPHVSSKHIRPAHITITYLCNNNKSMRYPPKIIPEKNLKTGTNLYS